MSGAISAVFQALCSPFSPCRRCGGGNIEHTTNPDGSGNEQGGDPKDSDSIGDNVDEDSTVIDTEVADNDGGTSRKRKRHAEKSTSTTTAWGALTMKAKDNMADGPLCQYFQTHLEKTTDCSNKGCSCLHTLQMAQTQLLVAKYLVWFDRKRKYDQDSILLDWYRYAHSDKGHLKLFMLPFNSVDTVGIEGTVIRAIKEARICSNGIRKVMMIGRTR